MPSFKNKKKMKKYVGEIRKSKVAGDSGIGALVDFPAFSGVIGGQNLWSSYGIENMMIHEKRLEDYCHKEYFVQAAEKNGELYEKTPYQIPIIRFPEYYYCPKCGQLDYVRKIAKNYRNDKNHVESLRCNNCNEILLPSRFVTSCECGHIDEFPYVWWTHKNSEKVCTNPRLKLTIDSSRSGLDSIILSCENCGAKNNMVDALGKLALHGWTCKGKSIWLGENVTENCSGALRTLMRGSNNLYYANTVTALTIPPWSNQLQLEIDKNYNFFQQLFVNMKDTPMLNVMISSFFMNNHFQERFDCTLEQFIKQVSDRFSSSNTDKNNGGNVKVDLKLDEYKALTGPDKDDILFKTQSEEIATELKPYITKVKLVKRLRAVQVLTGFRRIDAQGEGENAGLSCKLSSKHEKWLPGVELLGEGIFIELSKEKVKEWKKKNNNEYVDIEKRYYAKKLNASYGSFYVSTILLHTISHLLMRELAFNSGYDVASIKECIYSDEEKDMYGILIYTATTSSDGSLGGLVRQGKTESLANLIKSMLNKALWCSNDPICSEISAQGINSLNHAACYACTLVPETSCSMRNQLLDRCAVVGDKGYFDLSL